MSLEQALQANTEALNNHTEALRAYTAAIAGGAGSAAAASSGAGEGEKAPAKPGRKPKADSTAAEPKADKKAKSAEVTDERIKEVFGPLLAKTLDADQLAANKKFVASINAHFGVATLREIASQEDRAKAVEWGLARAEDDDFEIPGAEEDDNDGV